MFLALQNILNTGFCRIKNEPAHLNYTQTEQEGKRKRDRERDKERARERERKKERMRGSDNLSTN